MLRKSTPAWKGDIWNLGAAPHHTRILTTYPSLNTRMRMSMCHLIEIKHHFPPSINFKSDCVAILIEWREISVAHTKFCRSICFCGVIKICPESKRPLFSAKLYAASQDHPSVLRQTIPWKYQIISLSRLGAQLLFYFNALDSPQMGTSHSILIIS